MARLHPAHAAAPPTHQSGFVLPLAMVCSLLLLLSTTSLQLALLQSQKVQSAQEQRSDDDDLLVSAAHATAAQLLGRYRCLRDLPLSAWSGTARPADCPAGLNPQQLMRTELWGRAVEISGWDPESGATSGGVLSLRLADGSGSERFALSFQPALPLREAL
jgi:Tfp pilus assembly protein PilV